jgi:diacylglycerol kinase family enzyme
MQANALFSPRLTARSPQIIRSVRICVIFNPAARGNKARHFRRHLDEIGGLSALKATTAPGDARRLAAEAVGEGFDLIVAAGGDGTVNEVLNGLGDAPDGFARTCLGVLPLGTVNVFARELALPLRIEQAWEVLQRGREKRIDLPRVEFSENGIRRQCYFAQLAGAGFDARAIELVDWSHKKKIGPLAYVIAGLKALRERQPVPAFPQADLRDGFLDICILSRLNWWTLMRCVPGLLTSRKPPASIAQFIQAAKFDLAGEPRTAFELDGEWVGHLPATFSVERERLRVIVP